jgi:hypothetical protein
MNVQTSTRAAETPIDPPHPNLAEIRGLGPAGRAAGPPAACLLAPGAPHEQRPNSACSVTAHTLASHCAAPILRGSLRWTAHAGLAPGPVVIALP